MPNNTMYLICEKCLTTDNLPWEKCHVYIEKYYPSIGWAADNPTKLGKKLNQFLKDHSHGSLLGDEIKLVYDSQIANRGITNLIRAIEEKGYK